MSQSSSSHSGNARCPSCDNKTLHVTPTPTKVVLLMCPNCRGSWIGANDLAKLTGNPSEFERQFEKAKRSSRVSDKLSPATQQPMLEIPYRGKHPIYFCQPSQHIWVEKEEMRSVLS